MKKRLISTAAFALMLIAASYSQAFVETVEGLAFEALSGNDCVVRLTSGEDITGRFTGGTYVNNGLTKITVTLESGEKVKLVPEQIFSVHIRSSDLLKLFMFTEAGSSITELANANFNDIINREWVVFETAMTPKKTETYRILQLLNPGFDSKIKVFAEPGAKTGGLSVGGLQVTGGEDKSYLFVKGSEKAVRVKKGSYAENFRELFSDCPAMISALEGQKIKWDDVALHVFYHFQVCK